MEKPDETAVKELETPWGTWEELLLACAVNRYGTKSWDSVAIEIQKRSSGPSIHHLLTPNNCKQKYQDLKRRYTPKSNDAVRRYGGVDDDDDDKTEIDSIPWLDELRKLRVAELKRELVRYDLSIVSLQMKVKRLKEGREESENGGEKSDLGKSGEREREDEEERKGKGEPDKLSTDPVPGKPVTGAESESVNESNSTDPKRDNSETGAVKAKEETEPIRSGDEKAEPVAVLVKPGREDSCNGSSDSIAKEPAWTSVKVEADGGPNESPDLRESVAESKGGAGEEGAKESSDVHSSREGESEKVRRDRSSGDERENKDQSAAMKGVPVKSQPFVDLLEIVRSHKLGSLFGGRLQGQETPKYRNMIRQHVDLETVKTRLKEGWYSDCNKLFRDLLLFVNNVIVFFDKNSAESIVAIELRQLISKEMAHINAKGDLSAQKQTSPLPVSLPSKQPSEPPPNTLLLKPKIAGPMIVCRKRSSIAAKASASSSGRDQTAALTEEKPILELKQPNKSSIITEEHRITKKRTKESLSSGSRNQKKNCKNRTKANPNKNQEAISNQNHGRVESPKEHSEPPKREKKNMVDVKKQSAGNFLSKMKRNSSSNNGSLLNTLKNTMIGADNDGKNAVEQNKSANRKSEGRKEKVVKRSSGGRQAKEQSTSPAKRNVGRPLKKSAAPPPSLAVSSKRSRGEVGESEAVASKQPKKRSRK